MVYVQDQKNWLFMLWGFEPLYTMESNHQTSSHLFESSLF
jgi:hypothetical protein